MTKPVKKVGWGTKIRKQSEAFQEWKGAQELTIKNTQEHIDFLREELQRSDLPLDRTNHTQRRINKYESQLQTLERDLHYETVRHEDLITNYSQRLAQSKGELPEPPFRASNDSILPETLEDTSPETNLRNQVDEVNQTSKSNAQKHSLAIIITGLVCIAAIALLFIPGTPLCVVGDTRSQKKTRARGAADPERAFLISSCHFSNALEGLRNIDTDQGWNGSSGTRYAVTGIDFAIAVDQVSATNRKIDDVVQAQARQVNDGREVLGNHFDGLQLAMPVSESLYYSGPAGPVLSYHFQLVVANAAVGSGINTAKDMHEKARKHGQRLAILAQHYGVAV